jgi:hypothetical protein
MSSLNIFLGEQKSIVILICYFGKLPWYFRYFLHSCKFNTSIDFFLISDGVKFEWLRQAYLQNT